MRRLTIAIDGPTAAGKSTAGKSLAERLGYMYIDSGAMYRAVAWKALEEGVDFEDGEALTALASRMVIDLAGEPRSPVVSVDGRDITALIRTPDVDRASSRVSTVPGVRAAMVTRQQEMGRSGGVVMDGRDIGTHVFPKADVKFFILADAAERAKRRHDENAAKGRSESLDETLAAIEERDHRDVTRDTAPLRPASDAISIDTTGLSRDELLNRMLEIVDSRR